MANHIFICVIKITRIDRSGQMRLCYLIQFDLLLLLKPSIVEFQMQLNYHHSPVSGIGCSGHTVSFNNMQLINMYGAHTLCFDANDIHTHTHTTRLMLSYAVIVTIRFHYTKYVFCGFNYIFLAQALALHEVLSSLVPFDFGVTVAFAPISCHVRHNLKESNYFGMEFVHQK